MAGISKNILIKISIIVVLVFLAAIAWALLPKKTAPSPEKGAEKEETTEELLERLTPENAQPLSEEEQEELEELLRRLTPQNS
jgi:chromatin segregation and condensation protein Rec8/ScpA/Scc1 (kleisin family)